ncbi:type II toxin-antitoxin system RelE/ParE family toxin [Fervidibacter sacchari]|uniref:mRNA interferase RelE/StbE n=1 Tax=Candidatus Fervidibacter sacchari TaxID=1448929 RepID=A0ABT2EJH8_9BACT|nr:type II toxin-antitoxin system RelE/ParE family toxin [Candidatus Fervidibacter sacchari]MCS3918051.1 mRNA interferase RelE/StbE [Candidatus Fervidibacter sacchari]WKU15862.1 type II toxin-antitoxin system RelE/ParE family toxin [Candidatus Fervidibacter sacchari]
MGRSEARFEVILDPDAQKELERIPKRMRQRIVDAIEVLKFNPFWGKDILKLRGDLAGRYRLRVGEYRVIYRILEEQRLVIVEAVGTRGEVY